MKKAHNSSQAPAPIGPYSQATQFGNMVFLSGQVALDPVTGEMHQQDIKAETKQVMRNIEAVLKAADCTFADVVKCSIFLSDMKDFAPMNEVYGSYFQEPFPARECVQVSRLPKDANVEISVWACK